MTRTHGRFDVHPASFILGPGPTRIHRTRKRDTTALLCPCCAQPIKDWANFKDTYKAWRFGQINISTFSRNYLT